MRLSIETYIPCIKFGDKKGIEMIKNAGFDSVDYSFYGQYDNDDILGNGYKQHAERVREILDRSGLTCNQAHGPFDVYSSFDMTDNNFARLTRALEAASIMGAKHIIMHSLPEKSDTKILEYNTSYFKSIEPYCEKFNIKVAIENLYYDDKRSGCCRGRLHTPELLYEMLSRLKSEWFGVCIDLGHTGIVGIEPQDMIKAFDNKTLLGLHVHDNDYKSDQHFFPYNGNFNWDRIMSALKEINYKGDFTLEVVDQMLKFDDEFLPEALIYAAKVGRYLMAKFGKEGLNG